MDLTPPAGIDLNESYQSQLRAKYAATYALAVVAVTLRLLCRLRISKVRLWWDDYIICVALTFATGNFIDMMIWVERGVGTHIYPLGMAGVSHFYINLFACEILYTLSVCFTKYSILLFFWRIFNSTNIRIPIYVLASMITGWGLGVILTTVFQCMPIQGLWDYSVKAHCGVNINDFFIGNAVPNIITDWAMLILPLPYVWKIQRSTTQKVALCGAFAMGGFICIISIIRLVIMLDAYKTPSVDATWVFIGPSTWTAVETNIGIVSACLPSLGPLIKSITRKSGGKETSEDDTHKLSSSYGRSFGSGKSGYRPDYDIQLSGIDVTTSVDVESYRRHTDSRF
ncbi:hypothetical protein PEX1_011900 [Penicillium expansum]|uniref:Rhodopsin domain-containing protein n=1 Tax=Penicillium expansum TaxID=27334 RepID=A0A0A2I287_PENEN|nr:hypothetical protein PEX2_038380 [Penicillium expansum]KGO37239.1 hypothetical protein PEX1_011900 [Penicillium expansum]KGO45922.1 hypothetical protein PEXP_018020 [Penicillium expansum]KGO54350.1 hypothetical protein PEX2_038380 [Penicillium expansum]